MWGVRMELSSRDKAAAFCRELANDSLKNLAAQLGEEQAFENALAALRDGQVEKLESDLDRLEAKARAAGITLYPSPTRYAPLPAPDDDTGALWWLCSGDRCAGRGRVRPGQQPPVCSVTGEKLAAGPLTG